MITQFWKHVFVTSVILLSSITAKADDANGIKTPLDPIRLQTTEDIRKRDALLGPVFSLFNGGTLARAVQSLESVYGLNSYYFVWSADERFQQGLSDKGSVMAAAVPYFLLPDDGSTREKSNLKCYYERFEPRDKESDYASACQTFLRTRNILIDYGPVGTTPFDKMPAGLISGAHSLPVEPVAVPFTVLKKKKVTAAQWTTPYLLGAHINERSWNDSFAHHDFNRAELSISDQRPLFEAPVVFYLEEALKASGIKSLDATVVFLSGKLDGGKPYAVVYPDFTPLVPIPQPIIYVAFNATQVDLEKMVSSEAPRIYAYDVLFTKNLLPKVGELEAALSKYPKLEEKIARLQAQVKKHNRHELYKEVFLDLAYGSMWTVAGAGAIASGNPAAFLAVMLTAACTSGADCDEPMF